MIVTIVFWISLLVSTGIGFVYFRDLGDVSQMVIKVKRENMLRFIRHENMFIGVELAFAAAMALAHLGFGGGPVWAFWPAVAFVALFYAFPWVTSRNAEISFVYPRSFSIMTWACPNIRDSSKHKT